MLEDNGTMRLLEPDAMSYRELCSAKVCGETWAHPVLSNGMFYVRDRNELLCVRLSE